MRTIKPPQVRREEILDTAEALFAGKGFEQTSTSDILQATGIARGTLYYHFPSKEAILNGVVERSCAASLAAASRLAADHTIPPAERLFLCIASARPGSQKPGQAQDWMLEALHRPQNALMHEKLNRSLLNGLVAILTAVVLEGIAQGVFATEYPRESVEMALSYGSMAFDEELFSGETGDNGGDSGGASKQSQLRRIRAFLRNLELIFGAHSGSLMALAGLLGGTSTDEATGKEQW